MGDGRFMYLFSIHNPGMPLTSISPADTRDCQPRSMFAACSGNSSRRRWTRIRSPRLPLSREYLPGFFLNFFGFLDCLVLRDMDQLPSSVTMTFSNNSFFVSPLMSTVPNVGSSVYSFPCGATMPFAAAIAFTAFEIGATPMHASSIFSPRRIPLWIRVASGAG